MPQYADVDRETTSNRASVALAQGFKKMGAVGAVASSILGDEMKRKIKQKYSR